MNKWVTKWIKIYLKCFINLILFHRNVYPSVSFDFTTYQAFNLPQFIPINRHPDLQEYIEELILDVISKLTHIYRFCICIIDKENGLRIEKYVLDFGEFQHQQSNEQDDDVINETEVFDEFRSSLNSLISHLEKLNAIKDDAVSFEVVINAIDLELGHRGMENIKNLDAKLGYDRDINWTKAHEDENLPEETEHVGLYKPKINMTSLVGCDVGPLIIHQFCERLTLSLIHI